MTTIEQVIQTAQAQGLLPADAVAPQLESRPWPVVLLTAIGAWFAAIPLMAMVALLFGDLLTHGAGPYIVGILVLVAALVILRARDLALFVEQLAVPALLVGGGSVAMGLFRDLVPQSAAFMLSLIACAIAWMVPRVWLRVLLGALACGLLVLAAMPISYTDLERGISNRLWLAWQLAFALWILFQCLLAKQLKEGKDALAAAALDAFSTGWVLAVLLGLALWSGMTFLLAASIGTAAGAHAGQLLPPGWNGGLIRACSSLLALAAAGWLALRWSGVRRAWCAIAALLIAAAAWQLPALGAVLGVIALCASTGRLRLAAAAGLAASWIIGSYYYQLQYPLAVKAMVLMGGGALLGALAWLAAGKGMISMASTAATMRASGMAIVACMVMVLAVANGAIWQKEDLIANGSAVFIELAPADPRSLMQGDFMRLNVRLPIDQATQTRSMLGSSRPHVVAQRDARGVATLLRMHDGKALAAAEFLIELTPHDGGWIVVSDAWYFKEGEADRWAAAKYGEFRVMPDGRALLVGLRGANLDRL